MNSYNDLIWRDMVSHGYVEERGDMWRLGAVYPDPSYIYWREWLVTRELHFELLWASRRES